MTGTASVSVAEFPPDTLLLTPSTVVLDDAREAIVARGRERGFVTTDDLLEGVPDEDLSPEQIEEFLTRLEEYLLEEGIDIIEVPGDDPVDAERTPRLPAARDLKATNYDPVRMYLKDIGKVPLLTAPQEVDLAMRIEAGELAVLLLVSLEETDRVDRKGLQQLAGAIVRIREHQLDPEKRLRREGMGLETFSRSYSPKSRAEQVHFLIRIQNDGSVAKNRLIESNLRLVVSISKRYVSRGMVFLDLAQEGNLGLMRAVEKFDYTRGFKFSTYATWWIRQAITRAIADQSRVIRIPVHMTEYLHKVSRAERELVQELGREPLAEEIGRRIGIPTRRVEEILVMSRDPLSLEFPVGEEDDSHLGDFLADADAVVPADAASFSMLQEQLGSVLHSLSDRERKIIELRFGLTDGRPRTLEEVGVEFGVTRERIRQIESKSLSKLRHPSRAQKLRGYLGED
jgi:RNA polymerase primary sigma factor